MTFKQKVLKAIYPLTMIGAKLKGKNIQEPVKKAEPPISFYSLHAQLNSGSDFNFSQLKGKKVVLVNTASNCGYTNQYEDLQKLYETNKDQLTIIGFPANDFKEQEKGSDEEIAQFCKVNYGVSFPLAKKAVVIPSPDQHIVYQWLTDPSKNGWCKESPEWNFSKYIIDEEGRLTHYFGPAVSPLDNDFTKALSL